MATKLEGLSDRATKEDRFFVASLKHGNYKKELFLRLPLHNLTHLFVLLFHRINSYLPYDLDKLSSSKILFSTELRLNPRYLKRPSILRLDVLNFGKKLNLFCIRANDILLEDE